MAYFKTVIQIEILSQEGYADCFPDIYSLYHDIVEKHCSYALDIVSDEEVTKEEMNKLLEAQNSDPQFLDPDYFDDVDVYAEFMREKNEQAYTDAQKFIL